MNWSRMALGVLSAGATGSACIGGAPLAQTSPLPALTATLTPGPLRAEPTPPPGSHGMPPPLATPTTPGIER
jgi:hypothetical protein